MADFKQTITRLMASHVVLALIKTAWTGLGALDGESSRLFGIREPVRHC